MKNKKDKCDWVYNGDDYSYYDTECKEAFIFEAGQIDDNKFKYCPYCGKPIKQRMHANNVQHANFPLVFLSNLK